MINEAIQFMEKFNDEEGKDMSQSIDYEINQISKDYPKIIIIKTAYDKDKNRLYFKDFKIILNQEEDVPEGLKEDKISRYTEWIKDNLEYLDFLYFDKFIYPLGRSKAANNKMIKTTHSFMSFSLFHTQINKKWFSWENGNFVFDKKASNFELSPRFFDFLEKKTDEGNERLKPRIDSLRSLNQESNIREIYKSFVEALLAYFGMNKKYFRKNNEDAEKFLKYIDGFNVFLKLEKELVELYEFLYEKRLAYRIFNKERYNLEGTCPFCGKSKRIIGVPNNFNSFDENKFPNFHNTRSEPLNVRLCYDCCEKLNSFDQFLRKYKIDFFPLFIKDDFESKEIRYLRQRGAGELNFFGILEHILANSTERELDFILLHQRGDILYYDYVNNYCFELGEYQAYLNSQQNYQLTLKNLMGKFGDNNILGLKSYYIFNNFKKGVETHKKYLIYKYRQKIFHLVYRNQRSLSGGDVEEIVTIQLEKRIQDGSVSWPYNHKNSKDKELLDFYLNSHLFVRNPSKFIQKNGGKKMLEQIRKEKKDILKNEDGPNIDSDKKFAYYLGQIVYYLISQSETKDDKKMGLLTPMLSCQTPQTLKNIVVEKYLDKYGYKLRTYHDFRHKILSATLDYLDSKLNVPFSKIKIPFYIGFFDENIFYRSTKNNKEVNDNDKE